MVKDFDKKIESFVMHNTLLNKLNFMQTVILEFG